MTGRKIGPATTACWHRLTGQAAARRLSTPCRVLTAVLQAQRRARRGARGARAPTRSGWSSGRRSAPAAAGGGAWSAAAALAGSAHADSTLSCGPARDGAPGVMAIDDTKAYELGDPHPGIGAVRRGLDRVRLALCASVAF